MNNHSQQAQAIPVLAQEAYEAQIRVSMSNTYIRHMNSKNRGTTHMGTVFVIVVISSGSYILQQNNQ